VSRKLITVLLSVVKVSPIVAISVWSLNRTVTQLNDPCARWESRPAGEQGRWRPASDPTMFAAR
jgi:hypothetical protein